MRKTYLWYAALLIVGAACASAPPEPTSQQNFWNSLQQLCGRAFEGRVIEAPAGDTAFTGKKLVMHVRVCSQNEMRIPFHVGDNRSRTWVVTRASDGLRLKHDHRHEDGSEDAITQYGGDTRAPGSSQKQEFYADAHTAGLIPAAVTNVWTIEVVPGERFSYALRREGTDRRFRIDFDVTRAVGQPTAPW